MRQVCNEDYWIETGRAEKLAEGEKPCGKDFDDFDQRTFCPHPFFVGLTLAEIAEMNANLTVSAAKPEPEPDPDQYADLRDSIRNADTLEEAIGFSIGAASMCWETPEGAGVFNNQRAAAIKETLLELVRGYVR